MHSSTSSSNDRLPEGPWGRTLLLWAFLLVVCVAGIDRYFRMQGYEPHLTDTPALWSLYREKLDQDTDHSKQVVLLGGSRMQVAFDPEVFKRQYPDYELINLSLRGNRMGGKFADIVNNSAFDGILIIAVDEPALMARENDETSDAYVRFYRKEWSLDKKLNRILANLAEKNLTLRDPALSLTVFVETVLRNLRKGRLDIMPDYGPVRPVQLSDGRFYAMNILDRPNYKKRLDKNNERLSKKWEAGVLKPIEPKAFLKRTAYIRALLDEYVDRGGRVAVVRFPVSGKRRELMRRMRPKAIWDAFAENTKATAIHFSDYPALEFETPDGTHIDMRDRAEFTKSLLDVLESKATFAERAPIQAY